MTGAFAAAGRMRVFAAWLRAHRRDAIVLGAILAFSLVMFWLFRRDPTTTDDRRDFVIAEKLLRLRRGAEHYENAHFRLGWLFQVAFGQAILGKTAAAYYAVAIFHSLLSVGGVFLLVRQFFPLALAGVAAWLAAVNPYFLAFSSWLFVDLAVTGWFLLGLTCTVIAARADADRAARERMRFALLAGALLWLAWWTKVSIAPMLLLVPAVLWVVPRDRTSWRAAGTAVGIFAVLVLFELAVNRFYLHSALRPFGVVAHAGTEEYAQTELIETGKVALDLTWRDLFLRYPRRFVELAPGWIFLAMAALGALMALVTRNRALLWLLGMALVSWAAISLAVNSLDPLIFVLRTKFRYLHTAFVLFLVAGTCGIALLHDRLRAALPRWRNAVTGAAIAAVAALSVYQVGFHAAHPIGYGFAGTNVWAQERVYPRIRQLIDEGVGPGGQPVRRIITDYRSGRLVRLFMPGGGEPAIQRLDRGKEWTFPVEEFRPGDLIFLNWMRLNRNQDFMRGADTALLTYLKDPPETWTRIPLDRRPDSAGELDGAYRLYYISDAGDR